MLFVNILKYNLWYVYVFIIKKPPNLTFLLDALNFSVKLQILRNREGGYDLGPLKFSIKLKNALNWVSFVFML